MANDIFIDPAELDPMPDEMTVDPAELDPLPPRARSAADRFPLVQRNEFPGEEMFTREGDLTVPDSLIAPLEEPAPLSDRAARLKHILTATFDTDPEREAGVLALARATRMRSDVADRNYDELRTAWEANNFDVERWMWEHPHLAQLVLDRPELGAVVRQDETLSAFSQAWNKALDVMGALDPGETNQFGETAKDRAKNREAARATPANREVRQDAVVGAVAEDGPLARAAVPLFRFGETWAAMQASKLKTRIAIARTRGEPTFELEKELHDLELEATPRAFGEGAFEQIGSDVAAGLASQAALYEGMGPAEMAITALGAGIGFLTAKGAGAKRGATVGGRLAGAVGAGFKTATFVGSVELQFGDLYWELSQSKTDDGRVLTHEEAMGGAAIAAFLQAGVETVALEKALSSGPLGALLKGNNPRAALAGLMKRPSFRAIAARAGKDLAKGAFWEGSEEFIQEIIGRAAVFGTRSVTAGEMQDWSTEDVVDALVSALKAAEKGAIAGPAIASVSVMPDVMVQASAVERAQRNGELVAALGKLGDSPTVRAAPDAVAAMVERAAAEGGEPGKAVYVDAEAFLSLFQDEQAGGFAGTAEAAETLLGPDGWARVTEALATGDKVEVPLTLYLEKWGASEVAKKLETHTTLDPTLPTIAQMEKQQAELEKEEPSPAEAEFLAVMEEQLQKTGRAGSKKDVAAQVLLWRQAVRTAARRFSTKEQTITPDELFRGIVLEVRQSEQRIGEAGLTPMGGSAAASPAQAASAETVATAAQATATERLEQSVFHGSPHRFEKFSLHAIGTGEGAQAYGWGLYFAGKRAVAEHYRNTLASSPTLVVNGQEVDPHADPSDKSPRTMALRQLAAQHRIRLNDGQSVDPRSVYEAALKAAEEKATLFGQTPGLQEAVEGLRAIGPEGFSIKQGGALFEVEIPEDSDLLDYDAPIMGQSPALLKRLEALFPGLSELISVARDLESLQLRFKAGGLVFGEMAPKQDALLQRHREIVAGLPIIEGAAGPIPISATRTIGADLYEALSSRLGGPEEASRALGSIGIPGLRYLDGTSRGRGDGTHNYVIWQEERIDIRETFFQSVSQHVQPDALLTEAEKFEQGESARRKQTETPEFRAWFGDSKVVDAEGKPLRVYRGSSRDEGNRPGLWFTDRADTAAGYAMERATEWGDTSANVTPVYLSLQNPLEVDAQHRGWDAVPFDAPEERAAFERGERDEVPTQEWTTAELVAYAQRTGHDGLIVRNVSDQMNEMGEMGTTLVAFHPEQVKSAIGNRGTFDASDPSILNQEGASRIVRGHTDIARDGLTQIFSVALATDADLSTFLHESGHVFMDLMAMLAQRPDAPASVKRDWQTILDELGLGTTEAMNERREEIRSIRKAAREGGRDLTDSEQARVDELVRPFEQFARMWEAYLREGKAPSAKLAGAFRRFRNWLVSIYRSLRDMERAAGFPIGLNDEVRGVFDRLLATDREIEAAKGRAGLSTPLYRSPEEAGMTPEQWVAYLKAQEEATTGAQMALEHRMVKDQLREMESWWKEEETRQRDIAKAEFESIPARQAWRLIERRTLDEDNNAVINPDAKRTSLHRATVEGWLGTDKAKKFPLSKGGAHPDEFAPLFGFATGKEMIEAISALPNKDGWVKERAHERMLEMFPDIAKERDELQALADKGVHGDRTAKWLLAEWDALRRRAGKQSGTAPVDAIKRLAESIAEKRAVGRLDVGSVLRIERSLAERAAKEAARGNYAQAAVLKQQQLLNLYLHQALTRARDDRDELVDLSRKLSKNKARADLGKASPVYRDGVDLLLEAFGFTPEREGRDRPLPSVEQVVAQLEADAVTVGFDPEGLAKMLMEPRPWKELTVSELRNVRDAVKNIRAAARARNKVLIDGKRRDKAEVIAELIAEASKNLPDLGPRPSSVDAMTTKERLWEKIAGLHADVLKPEVMLRWLGGDDFDSTWFRAFVAPLQKAKAREVEILRTTVAPIIESLEKMPKAIRERMDDLVDGARLFPNHHPEVGPPRRVFELVAMLFNCGNEQNLQRLTDGLGITPAQLQAAFDEYLSPEILQWAQTVLDQMDSLWPLAADLEERVTGLRPRKVQPKAFPTKHGSVAGYYPIVYRSDVGETTGAWQEGQALAGLFDPTFSRPGTAHGHLKARAQKVKAALDLRLSVIPSHLLQAAHDVAFREALLTAGGLVMNPEVRAVLIQRLGKARADVFLAWLKDIGQMRGAGAISQAKGITRLALDIRANTTLGVLGWSMRTALGDFANIPAALPGSGWDLKPLPWAMGLAQFIANPFAAYRLAGEKSPELRTRNDQMHRELTAQLRKMTSVGPFARGPLAWFKEHAFTFMEWSDRATSTPIWLGRYRQALADGETDARAVEIADALIRKLWPSYSPVDLSQLARDKGFVGGSLLFHGYMNVALNVRLDLFHKGHVEEGGWSKTKAYGAAIASSLAFSASAMVLAELISGRGPEDDEEWEEWFLVKMMLAQIQDVPFGGDVASVLEAKMRGRPSSARASPLVDAAFSVGRAVTALVDEDKELDEKTIAILRGLGPVTGIPASAPARAADYLFGVQRGEQEADDPLDVAGGLIYGPSRD